MARRRSRLPWQYDDGTQTFTTPAGPVSLRDLADARYALATGRLDFLGPWAGWKLRDGALRGPHRITLRPFTAVEFGRWLQEANAQDARRFAEQTTTRPILRIVK